MNTTFMQITEKLRQQNYFYIFVLALLTFFTFLNMTTSDYIGDDYGQIVVNQQYLQNSLSSTLAHVTPDRPLLSLSIWANYHLFGQQPISYKIINILMHFGVTVLFFLFFKDILKRLNFKFSAELALLIAALHLVHPINNQAVNSVIQRGILMSVMLSLLSWEFLKKYLQQNKLHFYFISIALFAVGLLSKPNIFTIPLLFFLLLYFVYSLNLKKTIILIIPFITALLIPVYFYSILKINHQSSELISFEYFRLQSEIIFFYFSKYIYPLNLQFYYEYCNEENIQKLLSNSQYIFILTHLFLNITSIYFCFFKKRFEFLFPILGYIFLIPESSFFRIIHPIFDHRNYLSFIFFSAFLTLIVYKLITKYSLKLFFIIISTIILIFSLLNMNYTNRINTYDKWTLYNIESNPSYFKFTDYILYNSMLNNKPLFTLDVIKILEKNNELSSDLKVIKNLAENSNKSLIENVELIKETYAYVIQNPIRSQILVYLIYYFEKNLPILLEEKNAIDKINTLYFINLNGLENLNRIDLSFKSRAERNFLKILEINKISILDLQKSFESLNKEDSLRSARSMIVLNKYLNHPEYSLKNISDLLIKKYGYNSEIESIFKLIEMK